jgi:hypothetical protein
MSYTFTLLLHQLEFLSDPSFKTATATVTMSFEKATLAPAMIQCHLLQKLS